MTWVLSRGGRRAVDYWLRTTSTPLSRCISSSSPLRNQADPKERNHADPKEKNQADPKEDGTDQQKQKQSQGTSGMDDRNKWLIKPDHVFNSVPAEARNKRAFEEAIGMFMRDNVHRRGHKEFIKGAIKHLKEFGVHKDIDTYKKLMECFPKGKFVPTTHMQAVMQHYPQEQEVAVRLLDEMEWNAVYPDLELKEIVVGQFGEWTHVARKVKRMLYWYPRFRYLSKFRPEHVPDNMRDAAVLAVKMMCRDPATQITIHSSEEMWVVSGQAAKQREHIQKQPRTKPVHVDGPFMVYLRETPISYFTLTTDPNPHKKYKDFVEDKEETEDDWKKWSHKFSGESCAFRKALMVEPSMHEQEEGVLLGIACTKDSSPQSTVAWINALTKTNPALSQIPVIFRMNTVQETLLTPESIRATVPKASRLAQQYKQLESK